MTGERDDEVVDAWSAAYLRFETPEQEIRKFERRLRRLGEGEWRRDAPIVELFCGRGNGLHALARRGFTRLYGVDLSPLLASRYSGPAQIAVADCRAIPLATGSMAVAIVQGGLHHLPELPGDLEHTIREVRRVLVPGGRFVAVEPWRTPFLDAVHWLTKRRAARRLWGKLDALATMIEHERSTYEAWLGRPAEVLGVLTTHFPEHRVRIGCGKLAFVGLRGAERADATRAA